eukprot:m.1907 g.1907  ORF g.1907 m.1907 type:complete len:362 (-) comp1662_c0_seq1:194-1279(-)
MCLVFWKYSHEEDSSIEEDEFDNTYRLILVFNRDEAFHRPTQPACFWEDFPDVIGGYDKMEGRPSYGTWLGMSKSGRIAMLTNYQEANPPIKPLGRGALTKSFLTTSVLPEDYCASLKDEMDNYGGFNLIVGDLCQPSSFWYISNKAKHFHKKGAMNINGGVHGLSNALLDTPWPKLNIVKEKLKDVDTNEFSDEEELIATLLQISSSRERCAEEDVPDTGLPLHLAQALSSVFVHLKEEEIDPFRKNFPTGYGTMSQTVILVKHSGEVTFVERAICSIDNMGPEMETEMDVGQGCWSTNKFSFRMSGNGCNTREGDDDDEEEENGDRMEVGEEDDNDDEEEMEGEDEEEEMEGEEEQQQQ